MFRYILKTLPEIGRFNETPASMIDKAYLETVEGFFGRSVQFIKIRGVYYPLFLLASVPDFFFSALLSMRYAIGAAVRSDDVQDLRLEKQKKYNILFSKNGLALLSSLTGVGFISPRLVTTHFLPVKKITGVKAGGNYYHAADAKLETPEDVEELHNLIQSTVSMNKKIMPVGAGRSQGKQFLPPGKDDIVVDLKHFNTIQIDEKSKTAIVGAGVRWVDLQIEANKFKLAIQVMQASNIFSVGGSLGGPNCHGWAHDVGMLSKTVLSIDVMNAKGEIQTLTPNDSLFDAVTGSFGLMGIIVRVTLQLTDNELLKENAIKVPNSEYVKFFYSDILPNKNIRMHLFRLSLDPKNLLGEGIAVNFVKEDKSKPQKTPGLRKERDYGTREEQIFINSARRIKELRKFYWQMESDRLLKNESPALTTNAIMQPPINALFTPAVNQAEWLQEYFLPGEKLHLFLFELGKLLVANKVALLNASVRFVKKNEKPILSYASEDRFAVVLCFSQSLQKKHLIQAKKWLREAQHLTVKMGGTYYLSYQHVSSPEDFYKSYPQIEKFRQLKQLIDPDSLFVSGFYKKYIELQPKAENHIKKLMQNHVMKEEFKGFLQNVLQRVDANTLYSLLEDIITYNDTHEEIYEELCQRISEIMPSTIQSSRRVLNSLASIKRDLNLQAKHLLGDKKEINGLIEIGYPGRFINGFKKQFTIKGKIVVVLEQLSMTDYIQTGVPSPYHEFQKLDYNKPNLLGLKDNSAEVITCYVGLHHFPEKELDILLQDIRRVLCPNGHFLLVDHDVTDEKSMTYAHAAHTIFNAVNNVSLAEEMREIRNFQPMTYWVTLLKKHGLGYNINEREIFPLIRTNDPSRNRMVCFTKAPPELKLSLLSQSIPEPRIKHVSQKRKQPPLEITVKKKTKVSVEPVSLFKTSTSAPTSSGKRRNEEPDASNAKRYCLRQPG